jgi:hypothetical protein
MRDYYEVGKLRVCERHKEDALRAVNRKAAREGGAGGVDGSPGRMAKAERRRTRMINA